MADVSYGERVVASLRVILEDPAHFLRGAEIILVVLGRKFPGIVDRLALIYRF